MLYAYIRPLFEYSGVVLDTCSVESKPLLDTAHAEVARIVTAATKFYSIKRLFTELGWESLKTRRNKQKLNTFYKIMHDLAPPYLSILSPYRRPNKQLCSQECRS